MARERIVIGGGGAAGFFAAIACAEARRDNDVSIFERGTHFLTKVRISGGGRCNVTHTSMEPRTFSSHFPRGERALISALHQFSPEETVAWFQRRGVRLKTEPDGRIFPVTDSSGTVIDCLLHEAEVAGVRLCARTGI
ncbi:MAG: NAD(P)/FAD-dependent oxidoreductase, partial [Gemmatimonadota bacterium]|nr:NAD(P)/FAD-dependent oxidoreductase [Gemmatimonadota bacterium]